MQKLIKSLIERLVGKGLEITYISSFLRDLANTVATEADSSLHEVNRRLQLLEWDDFQLDDHTLQLILAAFEIAGLNRSRCGTSSQFHHVIRVAIHQSIKPIKDGKS